MATTTNIGITLVEQSQAQKEVTVNQALVRIDALLNTGAVSLGDNTPPGSPAAGDLYIVGASPTGDWSGHDNEIAYYDQIWRFVVPQEGMSLWVCDEDLTYSFDGSDWVTASVGEANTASNLGSGHEVFASKSGVDLTFKSLVAGSNVTIVHDADEITISTSGGGEGSSGYATVQEEGSNLAQRDTINFIGGGITASDNSGSSRTDVTLDSTLNALAAYNSNGLLAQTAADTFAGRTLIGPVAGITVTDGNGVSGNPTLALANDLSAVEGLSGTGIAVRTATDTWTTRSVAAGTGLSVSNGSGVSGNPTLSLNANIQDLSNVSISSETAGDMLVYSGSAWANTPGIYDTSYMRNASTASKRLGFDLSGATSSTTTTLTVSQTSNRTITLPDATTTLVGTDTTQTLTNKSIVATQLTGTLQAGQFPVLTGDITTSAGSLSTALASNAVSNAKFRQSSGLSLVGNSGSSTANVADITASTANQVLVVNGAGNALTWGAVNLASSDAVTGNLPVTNLNSGTSASSSTFWRGDGTWATPAGGGTVTTVSVSSVNGFAGSVSNATSTPAITISTSVTGVLKGNGTAISAATSGTDYAPGTSALSTGILKSTTSTGSLSIAVAGDFPTLNQNTTGSAATLTTARAIYGNNFDGSAALTQVIASTYGGTGNGFAKFSGPASSEKTFTLPNVSAAILTDNAAVTVAQGGTGITSGTSGGIPYFSSTSAIASSAALTSDAVVKGKGAGAAPVATGITVDDTTNAIYGYSAKLNAQTGTTYTLQASDNGKIVECSNASAITVTLPNSLAVGFNCTVVQTGAGQVTLSAGSGAVLRNYDSYTKTAGQWGALNLYVTTNSGGSSAVYVMQGRGAA